MYDTEFSVDFIMLKFWSYLFACLTEDLSIHRKVHFTLILPLEKDAFKDIWEGFSNLIKHHLLLRLSPASLQIQSICKQFVIVF